MRVVIPNSAEMWAIRNMPTIEVASILFVVVVIILVVAYVRSETSKNTGERKQVLFSRQLAGLLIEESGVFFYPILYLAKTKAIVVERVAVPTAERDDYGFYFCRAAGNRTRSLRTRIARTTGILRPVEYQRI